MAMFGFVMFVVPELHFLTLVSAKFGAVHILVLKPALLKLDFLWLDHSNY
jgi:hypothetical protein